MVQKLWRILKMFEEHSDIQSAWKGAHWMMLSFFLNLGSLWQIFDPRAPSPFLNFDCCDSGSPLGWPELLRQDDVLKYPGLSVAPMARHCSVTLQLLTAHAPWQKLGNLWSTHESALLRDAVWCRGHISIYKSQSPRLIVISFRFPSASQLAFTDALQIFRFVCQEHKISRKTYLLYKHVQQIHFNATVDILLSMDTHVYIYIIRHAYYTVTNQDDIISYIIYILLVRFVYMCSRDVFPSLLWNQWVSQLPAVVPRGSGRRQRS